MCMYVCIYAIRFIPILYSLYIVSCRKASSHLPSYLEDQGLLNALGTNLNAHLPWYRFPVGCLIVWLFVRCFVWRSVTYPYTYTYNTHNIIHTYTRTHLYGLSGLCPNYLVQHLAVHIHG